MKKFFCIINYFMAELCKTLRRSYNYPLNTRRPINIVVSSRHLVSMESNGAMDVGSLILAKRLITSWKLLEGVDEMSDFSFLRWLMNALRLNFFGLTKKFFGVFLSSLIGVDIEGGGPRSEGWPGLICWQHWKVFFLSLFQQRSLAFLLPNLSNPV